eukprot:TRINITY_DN7340_c0_g1_i4.p1 TRINITY_DN7340_c0_g1~~TRINITY_DN7340_c0_g1_i4.p1  ORF type:complete len:331 (-),score=-44.36 TRINITY_DN7340_c0_g1_i4:69-1061(-)
MQLLLNIFGFFLVVCFRVNPSNFSKSFLYKNICRCYYLVCSVQIVLNDVFNLQFLGFYYFFYQTTIIYILFKQILFYCTITQLSFNLLTILISVTQLKILKYALYQLRCIVILVHCSINEVLFYYCRCSFIFQCYAVFSLFLFALFHLLHAYFLVIVKYHKFRLLFMLNCCRVLCYGVCVQLRSLKKTQKNDVENFCSVYQYTDISIKFVNVQLRYSARYYIDVGLQTCMLCLLMCRYSSVYFVDYNFVDVFNALLQVIIWKHFFLCAFIWVIVLCFIQKHLQVKNSASQQLTLVAYLPHRQLLVSVHDYYLRSNPSNPNRLGSRILFWV